MVIKYRFIGRIIKKIKNVLAHRAELHERQAF